MTDHPNVEWWIAVNNGRHLRLDVVFCCFLSAAITGASVWFILSRCGAHFDLPFNYLKDANIFLVRAKTITEGNWVWRNPRLGMPFGANWIDFPMNLTLDSGVMWLLSRFTSSVPIIVNLDWMLGLAASAGLATYAAFRLGFGRVLSVCCAIVFVLQPYNWLGIKDLHCSPGAVPLVAAAAIELVRGKYKDIRSVPPFAWIGCTIVGLSYVYLSFFSFLVLASAAAMAGFFQRDRRSLIVGAILAGYVACVTLVDLSPSLLYQARNGVNASMLFKSAAEGEMYGLKIRYLLTPSPDHPVRLVRQIEQRLKPVKFPFIENENEYARLGTVGSIGLLVLIGLPIGALLNPRFAQFAAHSIVGPCAALTWVCILFASVGGLNVFFDTFVTPDIRAWARIFPFIGFYCVMAVGSIAASFTKRPTVTRIATVIIAVLAVSDQAMPSSAYDHMDGVYQQDHRFVTYAEKKLPPDSAVFELPYVDFPNDNHPGTLLVNDMLRPYLHSSRYRWSAGAVSGMTSAEWNRQTAMLPVPEMLKALAHRGFSGLWVDCAGYEVNRSPESAITREVRAQPVRDPNRRFLFYDLRAYAAEVFANDKILDPAEVRRQNPVQPVFERGFYFAENGADGIFRWSLRRGRIRLVNPLPERRRVVVKMSVATADPQRHDLQISASGRSDRMHAPGVYEREIDIPPSGRVTLDLLCECPQVQAINRAIYFYVSGFAIRE